MRIIFCGTPDFSVPPLKALAAAGHDITAVFTQPDKPKGRGQQMQKTPVKEAAEQLGIPVHQPTGLKNDDVVSQMAAMQADLMVVVAYGLIIPQNILDLPRHGCWNIHASLLPRWRGAAPIHRAILAGDAQTGVAIMQMEAGLDTGPVFHQYPTDIRPEDTGQSLHDRLSHMGAEAIVQCVEELQRGCLPAPQPQDHSLATYAHKLEKTESMIDWQQSARRIERQIRAFNPWPGSQAEIQGETVKLWHAKAHDADQSGEPGRLVKADKANLVVQCGAGQLHILEIQKAGKKRMPVAAFMASRAAWFTS